MHRLARIAERILEKPELWGDLSLSELDLDHLREASKYKVLNIQEAVVTLRGLSGPQTGIAMMAVLMGKEPMAAIEVARSYTQAQDPGTEE